MKGEEVGQATDRVEVTRGKTAARASPVARALRALRPPTALPKGLVISTAAHTVGTGLVVTLSAVYFTRVVGLSVTQVGVGLTLAGLVSIAVGVPIGRLSDHVGPRRLLTMLLLTQALAVLLQVWVSSFPGYLACVGLLAVATQGSSAVRAALIAAILPSEVRVIGRGYLRAVTNVGVALGTSLAALALVSLSGSVFRWLLVVAAVAFVAAAVLLCTTPDARPRAVTVGAPRLAAIRDRPYAAVVGANALMHVHYAVLELGIPLWVLAHTDAPAWAISVLLILNTASIIVLQVPVGRRFGLLSQAGPVTALAGVALAIACTLLAVSGSTTGPITFIVLVIAGLTHAVGELLHTNGSWAAGFGLAPESSQGQYQGLFATGVAAAQTAGPILVTVVVIANGTAGWLLAAAYFGLAGALFWLTIATTTRARCPTG